MHGSVEMWQKFPPKKEEKNLFFKEIRFVKEDREYFVL
jgi:hypothetical protein